MIPDNTKPVGIVALCVLLLLPGCTNSDKNHLKPELFVKIYVETITHSARDSVADSTSHLEPVLEKYRVTADKFQTSIEYYHNQPELWLQIFSQIADSLEEKKDPPKPEALERKPEKSTRVSRQDSVSPSGKLNGGN